MTRQPRASLETFSLLSHGDRMAALDVGWAGRLIAADPKLKEEYAQAFRDWADPAGGPIRAKPGDLVQELIDNAGTWDYVSQAPSLKDRSVLLVAAKSDCEYPLNLSIHPFKCVSCTFKVSVTSPKPCQWRARYRAGQVSARSVNHAQPACRRDPKNSS